MHRRDDLRPMGYQDKNRCNCEPNGYCSMARTCDPSNQSHQLTSEALKTNKRFVSCLASGGKAGKHRYAVQRSSMLASTLLESPDVKE